MMEIGKYNRLKVSRTVEFGLYMSDDDGNEVLVPTKYINFDASVGTEADVFVYIDSEGRDIATTLKPYAQVGEFSFMKVSQVNNIGAFLEWGIDKDVLVPFREQRVRMREGKSYIVYIYVDDMSKRIVASSKIGKFLGNVYPDYRYSDAVDILVYDEIPIGFKVIVDNLHYGILYRDRLYRDIHIGDRLKAYVNQVRSDGKIDLSLDPGQMSRTNDVGNKIMEYLEANGTKNPIGDSCAPDFIRKNFQCSKRDFKRAIGALYKKHKITIDNGVISKSTTRE